MKTFKEKPSDLWSTPTDLFNEINENYGPFQIDLCATEENSKCKYYCDDYLHGDPELYDIKQPNEPPYYLNVFKEIKDNLICWMNPPYSNPLPFIKKAWEDSKYCKIVCLVKVDPSAKWWAVFWDYEQDKGKEGCTVKFLPKRIKFNPPKGWEGKQSSPSFASAVIIMDRRGL